MPQPLGLSQSLYYYYFISLGPNDIKGYPQIFQLSLETHVKTAYLLLLSHFAIEQECFALDGAKTMITFQSVIKFYGPMRLHKVAEAKFTLTKITKSKSSLSSTAQPLLLDS